MKVTLDGFLHYKPLESWDVPTTPTLHWYRWDSPVGGSIVIKPQSIEVDVPDDFNPTSMHIAALQAEMNKAAEDFRASQRRISAEIQKLQAIGCATEVA